jgi:uncharacterized protein
MTSINAPRDLYLIPSEEDENYILYRPSKHLIALLSPENAYNLAILIQDVHDHKLAPSILGSKSILSLINVGFLDSRLNNHESRETKTRNCNKPINQKHTAHPFSPHEVTLDITRKCNMRCIYCYSCGGDEITTLSRECGQTAIDFCVSNAKCKGIFCGLHFHGSGEPSQEFALLHSFHDYAKRKCESNGIDFKCSVITNGLVSSKIIDFYAENMDEITLSLDGDKDSHDRQRPSVDGSSTFMYVYKTGKQLLDLQKKFNIRMTVTALNVDRLEHIVEFLISEFPGCTINIEPVTLVGRALEKEELACDPTLFADHLFNSMKIAIESNTRLFYSGVSGHSQREEFCAASTPSFCVCPNGDVTSCFSYSNKDIVKDLFIYGKYDENKKKFQFDSEKIKRLQTLTLEHDAYCSSCFCRSHCIGDCPAIREFELNDNSQFIEKLDMDFMLNRRCATNRRVVKLLLNDIVRGRLDCKPLLFEDSIHL